MNKKSILESFPIDILKNIISKSDKSFHFVFTSKKILQKFCQEVRLDRDLNLKSFIEILRKNSSQDNLNHSTINNYKIKYNQLRIRDFTINDEDLENLSRLPESCFSNIKSLFSGVFFDFYKNNISIKEDIYFSNLLLENLPILLDNIKSIKTSTSINLSNIRIGDDGAKIISEFLEKKECNINYLNLSNCKINYIGKIFLAESLIDNKTLKYLDLSDNFPFIRGFSKSEADNISQKFSEVIKTNQSLTFLDLSNSSFSYENSQELCLAIKESSKSMILKLEGKKLGHENKIDNDCKMILNNPKGIVFSPKSYKLVQNQLSL